MKVMPYCVFILRWPSYMNTVDVEVVVAAIDDEVDPPTVRKLGFVSDWIRRYERHQRVIVLLSTLKFKSPLCTVYASACRLSRSLRN